MPYTENIDQSQNISQNALDRIEQEGLPPRPDVFSLWYAYYSGLHPEIKTEIDNYVSDKNKITTGYCSDLYNKYFSTEHEKQLVEDTSKKIRDALAQITEMISAAGARQSKYNEGLKETSDKLNNGDGLENVEDVKDIVDILVTDTKKMIEENEKMETQLQRSSIEMEEMQQTMENLKREVMTDSLTGLPNRKCFETELKIAAANAMEESDPLSVVMCDIDHFKTFNDTFGHQVGDQVLRLVARSLVDGIKGQDLAARFGGEEFIIILPETKLANAEKVAESLRQRIAAKDIINQTKGEKLGRLSISLGVAEFHPGEPLHQLVQRADKALYKAKDAGRNCVVAIEYDPNLHSDSSENAEEDIVIDVQE